MMGILARAQSIDISGTTAMVEKEMVNTPVRRIQKIAVKIHVPHQLGDEQKKKLENAAHTCPVHKSMHPDVQMPIEFTWG